MKGYKKGSLLEEYFLNPHFKPTPVEKKKLKKLLTFPAKDSRIAL
tara:strand:+ start:1301 stop:1435 length:135 start_codon:yes stop_codon:yes gene_type:complete